MTIDKPVLWELLEPLIGESWWRELTRLILFHDPREGAVFQSTPAEFSKIPLHKRLLEQPADRGLPIGNLSSQFFANVYLNVLDQHVKHGLRCHHYIRYVDDFVLLHESPQQLNAWLRDITAFLPRRLHIELNPAKTILQPIERGIDFVGHVIKPWCRSIRRRTFNEAISRTATASAEDLFRTGNSYFGLLRQATSSHHDRAQLANALRRRGHTINGALTKTYRRNENG